MKKLLIILSALFCLTGCDSDSSGSTSSVTSQSATIENVDSYRKMAEDGMKVLILSDYDPEFSLYSMLSTFVKFDEKSELYCFECDCYFIRNGDMNKIYKKLYIVFVNDTKIQITEIRR